MDRINKAFAITNAKIGFVSLVDKAANKQPFIIAKAENGKAQFSTFGEILKADSDSHYITGIVYEPMVEDAHGNYMTEDEIRKAAYGFAKNGNQIDLQHNFESVDGVSVVENWIAKADTTIEGKAIKKGTWLMTVEVSDNDDIWQAVEKGELTGFSMGGVGTYSEVDEDITGVSKSAASQQEQPKGLFKRFAAAMGFDLVEKGAVSDKFRLKSISNLFWNAWYSLEETLSRYNYFTDRTEFETNEDTIKEALSDFSEIVLSILAEKSVTKALLPADGVVEKAGKKLSAKNREALTNVYESLGTLLTETAEKEDNEVDENKIQKMIDDSVATAIAKALGNGQSQTEPAGGDPAPAETPVTQETVEKMVAAAVQKALEPAEPAKDTVITADNLADAIGAAVQKAMEPVLKAKGLPSNLNDGPVAKSEGEQHFMAGIL